MINVTYSSAAVELKEHIISLIDNYPEILEMSNPFELFNIKEFTPNPDLSYAQAVWAFNSAKKEIKE